MGPGFDSNQKMPSDDPHKFLLNSVHGSAVSREERRKSPME